MREFAMTVIEATALLSLYTSLLGLWGIAVRAVIGAYRR